ncbi:MAG: triacylglycerol lipase [Proteobacteria bacterium]|nr:triacylglycerol lipase [Pseudomonadota bacterium]
MAKVLSFILVPVWLGLCSCAPSSSSQLTTASKRAETKSTKYPVVLQHGFLGFDKIVFFDYFYGVPDKLRAEGYKVYTPKVAAINSIAVRAQELASQIDQLLQETGAAKVNIIGHSMGGLDARYLVSTLGYGDRVASISSISTPHQGTHLADTVLAALGMHNPLEEAMAAMMGVSGDATTVDNPKYRNFGSIDLRASMYSLSSGYMNKHFNPENPDDDRVFYQSWSGEVSFQDMVNPDWLSEFLHVTHDYLALSEGPSDGIVSVQSARYGHDNGTFKAHHLDEIGQLFGHQAYNFSYQQFYSDMVAGLAKRGF